MKIIASFPPSILGNTTSSSFLKDKYTKNFSSIPISFGAKQNNNDSFKKQNKQEFIIVEGINRRFGRDGLKFIEKQTHDKKPIERITFFENEKDIWKVESFSNGVHSKTKSFFENGELACLSEYKEGIISKKTLYRETEDTDIACFDFKNKKVKIKKGKIKHSLKKVIEYKDGKMCKETEYHDNGKSIHLIYTYDKNENMIGIKSFRENGAIYHSIWEGLNGFYPEDECEDELGIPIKNYKRSPKKDLPKFLS